ncbi:MAG: DUF3857 domain-containing protein [Lentisphaeria bacterium]|nr:DUF3857 domain-containing protein [Lentisphaeria bacterium]
MNRISFLPPLFLLATLLAAQNLSWENDTGFLDPETLRQTALQTTSKIYPDADTVRLDTETRIEYQADGTYLQIADNATKIMTLAGADSQRVLQSFYSASYSRAKISLVQILKPTGETIDLDLPSCTQEMADASQMDSNIYDPNHRIIKVAVANLAPGDVLRAVYVDEIRKPRVPNSFSELFSLEDTQPILHERIIVSAPSELPLQSIAIKNPQGKGPAFLEREENGRRIYQWEVHDVPQVFPEPAMPQLYYNAQRVIVSTFRSWEEVSRWYDNLCEPRLALDDDLRNGVELLTKEASTDQERIIALYNFVSQRVRYMGLTLEDNAPGYEPHDVTLTFAQRAGVCRDMAALLAAMLRAAGFEAPPTPIHAGPPKDIEVPLPYFNHALTAVKNPQTGDWMLLDPTNTNTRDPFPAYLSDKSYLVATPNGDPLRVSAVTPYEENMVQISTSGKLTEEGDLLLQTKILFQGIADNAYRNSFLDATPEQRRKFFEKQLSSKIPGAQLNRLEILPADLQDLTTPLQAKLAFTAQNALITELDAQGEPVRTAGKNAMLRFPLLGNAIGMNFLVFSKATLEKRRFPLQAGFTAGVSEEIAIDLPQDLQLVSAPEYSVTDTPHFVFSRTLDARADRLRLKTLYASKAMRYSPEEYLALKKALAQKDAEDRKMVIFNFQPEEEEALAADEAPAEQPDLEYQEDRTVITILAPSSWIEEHTLKFQVMTYAGIQAADISIPFNPVWENVQVLAARVTNGTQTMDTPPENINVMDAPWAASAPRYPAGKILVVNLPGIDIGSQVELQIQRTCKNRSFFSCAKTLRGPHPIRNWSLDIVAPQSMSLAPGYYPDGWLNIPSDLEKPIAVEQKTEKLPGDQLCYHYGARDIPALHREGAQPPAYAFLPTVIVSHGDWTAYASIVSRYVQNLGDGGQAIQKLVAGFQNLPQEEQLVKIRNFVEMNIRRSEPAFTALPLSRLSAPEITARDGYGNSADRAILYQALLKALGIPSEIYLASAQPQMTDLQRFLQKTPNAAALPNWLVKVDLDGREVWLNDQTQYGQFGTCAYDHGVLLSLKKGKLEVMKLKDELQDLVRDDERLEIQPDGTGLLTLQYTVSGVEFGKMRRYYDQLTPEERRRHYVEMVSAIAQDAIPVTKDLHTDFSHYPGTVSFKVQIPNCASFDGDFCYLRLPTSLSEALAYASAKRQFHPLYRSGFQKEVERLTVKLPADYPNVVLAPADFSWRAPDGAGTISWKHTVTQTLPGEPLEFQFTYTVDLKPGITPLRLYPAYQEAFRRLLHPAANTLLLSK